MEHDRLSVLLIEDDEVDVIGLQRAFELAGIKCRLDIAKTGEAGLELLRRYASQSPPARLPIVLLDVNLPGENGLNTLKSIREQQAIRDVRVFVWSNVRSQRDVDIASKLDIEGFLLKSELGSTYVHAATMLHDYWKLDNQT